MKRIPGKMAFKEILLVLDFPTSAFINNDNHLTMK